MSILNQIMPYYTIELYNRDSVLIYTIENEPITLRFKTHLTSNVGTFSFNLPISADGFNFEYNDIAPYWFTKIVLAWPTELENMVTFIGRIWHINTTVSDVLGYRRTYKGRDYGALLQRNFKGYKEWIDTDASVVVTEVATDLGLGTSKIETDTTDVTLIIDVDRHDSYFNIMKAVSDYWYDANTQIKKDFCVDASADLVWKSRPWRTSGVESVSISDMSSYNLLRDIQSVKNWIHVYGAKEKPNDSTKDFGTDMATPYTGSTVDQSSASGQKNLYVTSTAPFSVTDTIYIFYSNLIEENVVASIDPGVKLVCENNLANTYPVASGVIVYAGWGPVTASTAISSDATIKEVGSRSVKVVGTDGGGWCGVLYKPTSMPNLNFFPTVNFFIRANTEITGYVRYQDSSGLYASRGFSAIEADSKFHFVSFYHGKKYVDGWTIASGFDWENVNTIEISMYDGTMTYYVDGLYFDHRNFYGFASDSASYTDYGYGDLMQIDENLHSDSDCEKRAKALCYQKSGVPYRLDFQVSGNPNLLIGDRIPITIDPDDLINVDFDVLSVEHVLSGKPIGWRTNVVALNTADLRTPPATTIPEYLIREKLENLLVAKGRLIVR